MDAVDIDKASVEEATVNFEASQWRGHLNAYCIDIVDFQTDKKFDLIVSNPPFFNRFSKCDSERKSRARHNDVLLQKIPGYLLLFLPVMGVLPWCCPPMY